MIQFKTVAFMQKHIIQLKTVAFMQKHGMGGLDMLRRKFSLRITQSERFPNLYMFKYNQIDSPMDKEIVQECRGLILDSEDDWSPVSWPYHKFFNYAENHAADIDWDYAIAYEKLDGSLMTLYYYDNAWQVSSSGNPDAAGQVGLTKHTFNSLFWQVWSDLGYRLPEQTDLCYMFELMTPYNQIVVKHETSRLVLHGVRNVVTGEELSPVLHGRINGYEIPTQYPIGTDDCLSYIISEASKLNGVQNEGFVVVDKRNFNRIKIKAPDYLAKHRLKSSIGIRPLVELARTGEVDEVVSYFPEYKEILDNLVYQLDGLKTSVQMVYDTHKHIEKQKDFAIAISGHKKYSGLLFTMRKQGKSVVEVIAEMSIDHLIKLLDVDDFIIPRM